MSKKEDAKTLIGLRDEIDAAIEKNMQVLTANNCTMDSPLIDAEGFPIASIDVYSVRHARHDIICLRNDRKEVMERLTEALEEVHEECKPAEPMEQSTAVSSTTDCEKYVHRTSNTPFAKVSTVTPDSPASLGGLCVGDLVIQYGPLHHGNFTDMQQLAQTTANNEGKTIRVTVMRDLRPVRLEIQPRKWNGKGILGCGIVPETTANII